MSTSSFRVSPAPLVVVLLGIVLGTTVVSAGMGAFGIPPGDVVRIIGSKTLPFLSTETDPLATDVLWNIRLPRIALGLIVGAALGCAGAVMQGAFGNPLAEPGIVGVSSGAMVGSALQIVTGATPLGRWSLPAAAFIGGLVSVSIVYRAARYQGRTETLTLVLLGIAMNALNGALIGYLAYVADDAEIRSLTSWTLGSVGQATWNKVLVLLPALVLGVLGAFRLASRLDVMSLGDRTARHVGIDVERTRLIVLLVVASLSAAAVAMSGVIVFVGLIVPHIVRLLVGPRHKALILLSIFVGAALLIVADTIARNVVSPSELPLGVVTSVIGGPVFVWQLMRMRQSYGGMA